MPQKEFNTIQQVVEQLESCHYECKGGPLELNIAFLSLKDMAASPMKLAVVETQEESFARALNITVEREAEIDNIIEGCYVHTSTFPEALADASLKLNNANELAYASFYLGAFAESRRGKYELLHKFLG